MAKPTGKSRSRGSDGLQDHDTGQTPLRPRAEYKARGKDLGALPNTDLMPAPNDGKRTIKPRTIEPAPTDAKGAGLPKALIFGGVGVVVAGLGAFFALSGGDTPPSAITETPVATATQEPAASVPASTVAVAIQEPNLAQPAPASGSATLPGAPLAAPTTASRPDAVLQPAPPPETAPAAVLPAAAPDFLQTAPAFDTPALSTNDGVFVVRAATPAAADQPTNTPELAAAAETPAPFGCRGCTSYIPGLRTTAVTVYHGATLDADATVALLGALGAENVSVSAATIPVVTNQVRFYSADDLKAAQILGARYDATLVDLRWFAPAPLSPTLDLWLVE